MQIWNVKNHGIGILVELSPGVDINTKWIPLAEKELERNRVGNTLVIECTWYGSRIEMLPPPEYAFS